MWHGQEPQNKLKQECVTGNLYVHSGLTALLLGEIRGRQVVVCHVFWAKPLHMHRMVAVLVQYVELCVCAFKQINSVLLWNAFKTKTRQFIHT